MVNIQFDNDSDSGRNKNYGRTTKFIRDKLDVSGKTARKIIIGVGIVALLVTLYVWITFIL